MMEEIFDSSEPEYSHSPPLKEYSAPSKTKTSPLPSDIPSSPSLSTSSSQSITTKDVIKKILKIDDYQPGDDVFDLLFAILNSQNETFSRRSNKICNHHDEANFNFLDAFLKILVFAPIPLQIKQWTRLLNILNSASLNFVNFLCHHLHWIEEILIKFIRKRLSSIQNSKHVFEIVFEILQKLAAFSVTVGELQQFLKLLIMDESQLDNVTMDDKLFLRHLVLEMIKKVSQVQSLHPGPDDYFIFNGVSSGLILPPLGKFPDSGYSLCFWIRVERFKDPMVNAFDIRSSSNAQNYSPYILSLRKEDKYGKEVCLDYFFINQNLAIKSQIGNNKIDVQCFTKIKFQQCRWYFLCVCHAYHFLHKSELALFIDGQLKEVLNVTYPRGLHITAGEIGTNHLGSNIVNPNPKGTGNGVKINERSQYFFGQIGKMFILHEALSEQDVGRLNFLGPNVQSDSTDDASQYSSHSHPHKEDAHIIGQRESFFHLGKRKTVRILFLYDPRATTGKICYETSSCSMEHVAAAMPGLNVVHNTPLWKALNIAGGVELLISLLQYNKTKYAVKDEDVNEVIIRPDETSSQKLQYLLNFIGSLISRLHRRRSVLKTHHIFSLISYVMRKQPPDAWNFNALGALQMIGTAVSNSEELFEEFFTKIYLNFKVWMYTNFEVQKHLLSLISQLVRERAGVFAFTQCLSIQLILDIFRTYLYYSPEPDQYCFHVASKKRPCSREQNKQIQLAWLKNIGLVSNNRLTVVEMTALVAIVHECSDPDQVILILQMFCVLLSKEEESSNNGLESRGDPWMCIFKKTKGLWPWLSLLKKSNHITVRSYTLKVIGYLLRIHNKYSNDTIEPDIFHALKLSLQTTVLEPSVTGILFEILLDSLSPNLNDSIMDKIRAETENTKEINVMFKNYDIIPILLDLICEHACSDTLRLDILTDLLFLLRAKALNRDKMLAGCGYISAPSSHWQSLLLFLLSQYYSTPQTRNSTVPESSSKNEHKVTSPTKVFKPLITVTPTKEEQENLDIAAQLKEKLLTIFVTLFTHCLFVFDGFQVFVDLAAIFFYFLDSGIVSHPATISIIAQDLNEKFLENLDNHGIRRKKITPKIWKNLNAWLEFVTFSFFDFKVENISPATPLNVLSLIRRNPVTSRWGGYFFAHRLSEFMDDIAKNVPVTPPLSNDSNCLPSLPRERIWIILSLLYEGFIVSLHETDGRMNEEISSLEADFNRFPNTTSKTIGVSYYIQSKLGVLKRTVAESNRNFLFNLNILEKYCDSLMGHSDCFFQLAYLNFFLFFILNSVDLLTLEKNLQIVEEKKQLLQEQKQETPHLDPFGDPSQQQEEDPYQKFKQLKALYGKCSSFILDKINALNEGHGTFSTSDLESEYHGINSDSDFQANLKRYFDSDYQALLDRSTKIKETASGLVKALEKMMKSELRQHADIAKILTNLEKDIVFKEKSRRELIFSTWKHNDSQLRQRWLGFVRNLNNTRTDRPSVPAFSLERTETKDRRRLRMKIDNRFHKKAIIIKKEASQEDFCNGAFTHTWRKSVRPVQASIPSENSGPITSTTYNILPPNHFGDEDSDPEDDVSTLNTSSSELFKEKENDKAKIHFSLECSFIRGLSETKGILHMTSGSLTFVPHVTIDKSVKSYKCGKKIWRSRDIHKVYPRRYLLQNTAIELFFSNRKNSFLTFLSQTERTYVLKKLLLATSSFLTKKLKFHGKFPTPRDIFRDKGYTEQWVRGELSNFEYLMKLNTFSGRTYNDISQYPIFPWVISDYSSEQLDLRNPASFRDFSLPIGAQDPMKRRELIERYEAMEDDDDIPKFHYGSHYSNPGIVFYYLLRLEPFTSLALQFNDGQLDIPSRLFGSLEVAYENAKENILELTPEFFYLPDFLYNSNRLDISGAQGCANNGDVSLPPWAQGSPEIFITKHRNALESEYVSSHLHEWIDLIFGHLQHGPSAVAATNLYYYLTYEGTVDISSLDPSLRLSVNEQIYNFGQTPQQLFTQPHPRRQKLNMFPSTELVITTKCDAVYPLPSNHSICAIFSLNDTFIFVSQYALFSVYSFIGLEDSKQRVPFTIEFKKTLDPASPLINRNKNFGNILYSEHVNISQTFCNSTDGKFIFSTGEWDGSFRIWHNGKNMYKLKEHTSAAGCIASDADFLITGSRDCSIMVYQISTLLRQANKNAPIEPKFLLYGHSQEVVSVDICYDLDLIVSGSVDGTVLLHKLRSGQLLQALNVKASISWVRLSKTNGRFVIYSHSDQKLFAYTINGRLVASKNVPSLTSLHISIRGNILACSLVTTGIVLYSLYDLSPRGEIQTPTAVSAMRFFLDDQLIIFSLQNGTFHVKSLVF